MAAGGADRWPWDSDGQGLVLAGEPRLAYQPVVDLMSGRVLGFEALLRWQHPTEGIILPQLLIPWAEANGDIVALGGWVLAEGCRQAMEWPPSVQLAVNCSIVQLRRGVASQAVQTALEGSGMPPDRLTIEVTEHALSDEPAAAELETIAALGVQIAVDDVGTSWSSFELLRRLAVNTIKIDESFVSGMETGGGVNRMVVETVIHLAHSSGMSTVAEGVESAAHAAAVQELESDAGQGYFFAPPLDEESATTLANVADLCFPLDGDGWSDDDDWPFPGCRAESTAAGNSLSHARHARSPEPAGGPGDETLVLDRLVAPSRRPPADETVAPSGTPAGARSTAAAVGGAGCSGNDHAGATVAAEIPAGEPGTPREGAAGEGPAGEPGTPGEGATTATGGRADRAPGDRPERRPSVGSRNDPTT